MGAVNLYFCNLFCYIYIVVEWTPGVALFMGQCAWLNRLAPGVRWHTLLEWEYKNTPMACVSFVTGTRVRYWILRDTCGLVYFLIYRGVIIIVTGWSFAPGGLVARSGTLWSAGLGAMDGGIADTEARVNITLQEVDMICTSTAEWEKRHAVNQGCSISERLNYITLNPSQPLSNVSPAIHLETTQGLVMPIAEWSLYSGCTVTVQYAYSELNRRVMQVSPLTVQTLQLPSLSRRIGLLLPQSLPSHWFTVFAAFTPRVVCLYPRCPNRTLPIPVFDTFCALRLCCFNGRVRVVFSCLFLRFSFWCHHVCGQGAATRVRHDWCKNGDVASLNLHPFFRGSHAACCIETNYGSTLSAQGLPRPAPKDWLLSLNHCACKFTS